MHWINPYLNKRQRMLHLRLKDAGLLHLSPISSSGSAKAMLDWFSLVLNDCVVDCNAVQ